MSLRIILLAVMLLGGASVLWLSQNQAPVAQAETTPVETVKILVAAQAIQAGTLLKDVDFREQEMPPAQVQDDALVANDTTRTEVRGAMLRRYLEGGERIRKQDILRPKDRGFLAAVLAPGTRAVSIAVDATTGASGLISPGDLVDVILSQEFARGETPIGRRVVAETVLNMVRVIAVDQQIAQGAPTSSPTLGAQVSRVASTISLQLTPEQAARIIVAERLGRLTLTVRSIDGDAASKQVASRGLPNLAPGTPERAEPISTSVFGADVSSALSKDEPAITPRLRLIQGDAVSDVVFH